MVVIAVIFAFFVVVSLFSYIDAENWRSFHLQLHANINRSKPKSNYGYQRNYTSQTVVLAVIVYVTIAIFTLSYFGQTIINNFDGVKPEDKASDISDTTAFTLNDIETELPASEFVYQGDNGDGLPQAVEGSEVLNDDPNQEVTDKTQSSEPKEKQKTSTEQSVYDYEKNYRESLGGDKARKEIADKREKERIEELEKKKQKQKVDGGVGGSVGSKAGSDGSTMVEWEHSERKAYNNDDWQVRVPSYTCGIGVNDKVVLKLRVDMNGKVFAADMVSGANSCCIEQAKKYALKSRFEPSDKPIQEIKVIYRFKSQ